MNCCDSFRTAPQEASNLWLETVTNEIVQMPQKKYLLLTLYHNWIIIFPPFQNEKRKKNDNEAWIESCLLFRASCDIRDAELHNG